MKFLSASLLLFSATAVTAFAPSYNHLQLVRSNSAVFAAGGATQEETEAERLLRKARELRAAAAQEEQKVHESLTKKKADRDAQTDKLIQELFFSSTDLVDNLRKKRPGSKTLEAIVDRLDEREVAAKGLDHVKFKMVGEKTEFERVKENPQDQAELERLDGKIDDLLQAVEILDKEFMANKKAKGESYVAHAEEEHWGGGKCAQHLTSRVKEIRRERSEQFQKRMEEFREAQRRKDDDDHKFKGYTDLGNLN